MNIRLTLVYLDAEMNPLVQSGTYGHDHRTWGLNDTDLAGRDWSPSRIVDDYADTVDRKRIAYADVTTEELAPNSNIVINVKHDLYEIKKHGLGVGLYAMKV